MGRAGKSWFRWGSDDSGTAAAISNATDNGMSHRTSVGQKPTVTGSRLESTKITSTIRNGTAISIRITPPACSLNRTAWRI
jgi:hypothetical protein